MLTTGGGEQIDARMLKTEMPLPVQGFFWSGRHYKRQDIFSGIKVQFHLVHLCHCIVRLIISRKMCRACSTNGGNRYILNTLVRRKGKHEGSSSVSIESRLRTGWPGVQFPAGAVMRLFLFATTPRAALEPTQSPIHWVAGALTPGVKRPGREADHSRPSSADVTNACSYIYTPPPPICILCVVLNYARDTPSWRGA
jgi:hypothetical protein